MYLYNDFSKIEKLLKSDEAFMINTLISFGNEFHLTGNLWALYITYYLINHENCFSLSLENNGKIDEQLKCYAKKDLLIIKDTMQIPLFNDFKFSRKNDNLYHKEFVKKIEDLTSKLLENQTIDDFTNTLINFYQKQGAGIYSLYQAFRVDDNLKIIPIINKDLVSLDDLIFYEDQKSRVMENTMSFISGHNAHNVLLYGDSGTGKSSTVKAVLNKLYPQGLRMIELNKTQLHLLKDLLDILQKRYYKFIIYLDDFSFEEHETNYKYLKSIIEGGLNQKPTNVLLYATSNRRHLIKESLNDNEDLHRNETQAEKLSLSYRFGLSIYYGAPTSLEYQAIVKILAKKNHLKIDEKELIKRALEWELRYGGLSGRTAVQFITSIKEETRFK